MSIMKRWNGWGDEMVAYPLPEIARDYLKNEVGEGEFIPDARLEDVLARIPEVSIPDGPAISTDPEERLRHARGQSLPDWVALRSGQIPAIPDGVAYPSQTDQVRHVIDYALQHDFYLIPYGGGTSVAGHINPPTNGKPVLTVDMSRLNRLIDLDKTSLLGTFEAGVCGPDIERQLRNHGFTLGHYPQSFEYSTLGGWIATRSSGQQSYFYGRIEDLFAGGHLESPAGPLEIPVFPASAAGPDLRHLVLGSEGRLGVITHATVRVHPLPDAEGFYGVLFPEWEAGFEATRQVSQKRIPVSMLRLSDATETETSLALSGKRCLIALARFGLRLAGLKDRRCMLVFGVTGDRDDAGQIRDRAAAIFRSHKGVMVGPIVGNLWRKSRFSTPYLRNTLWEMGYALDTLETAAPWQAIPSLKEKIHAAMKTAIAEFGERALIFSHLSHFYPDGASLYVTYLFRRSSVADETLERWQRMKSKASQVIVDHRGTISHQHGVGRDHAPYLEAEKGPLGMAILKSSFRVCDPQDHMNPGVMISNLK